VFVHPDDIAALGLHADQFVDLVSEWTDGSERRSPSYRVVPYQQPRGCAAAYYPETNALVPLESSAVGSNCPTSKSVIIRLEPTDRPPNDVHGSEVVIERSGDGGALGSDEGHKSRPQPEHLS
jgi:formate dehydrogenase major subunit